MKIKKAAISTKMRAQQTSGNVFADLGLPHPEQEL